MVRVLLLGAPSVELDGERVELPPGRPGELLGWLALHPGAHSRRELAGRFWPDVLDASARASLRNALYELRQALGAGVLRATREQVGLDAGVWVDALAFAALLEQDRLEEALALVRGALMEGRDEDWVYAERERQNAAEALAHARVARDAEAAGDLSGAVTAARRRAALDPLSEESHRELMRLLAAAGDQPAALAVYARLEERLRHELGIVPSAEARRLAGLLRGAGELPAPALPAALARTYGSPLVGRRKAISALRAEWEAACAGTRRVVLLTGEPGIGKTRLASEFARAAFAGGALVLYGRAHEEPLVPYQPLAEALRPFGELARHVSADALVTSDPAGARYRLFETVAATLGIGTRPVLLVLDDLHWADGPTAHLIRHVASYDPAPLLILGTCRDAEPLADLIADLRRDGLLVRIALEPLSAADVDTLAAQWPGANAPAGLAERTGGNPFFVEEVLRAARETGELGVPQSVRDVLAQRLARLGPEANRVLALAAVAGREFGLEVLTEDHEAVVAALEAALAAELIREEPRAPGRYAFVHALVREAIYTGLSRARRALLHGEIAVVLPEERVEERAHHFWQAGMGEQAVEASVLAGRRAAAQLAYEDAAAHFGRALELAPGAGLLLERGEALLRGGEVESARACFDEAAALTSDPLGLARAALGRSGLGVTVLGHDEATVALLERALAALPDGERALRARLLGRMAIELYHASQPRREELSAEAVGLAREAAAPDALADVLSARHVALWSPRHLDERLALAGEMIGLAPDRERALQGRNWRVLDLLEQGDLAAAEREIAEHGRLADELRLPGYQWWTPMWRAMLAVARGRFEEAERLRAEALTIGRRAGDRVAELFAWIQTTYVRFEREARLGAPDVPDPLAVQAVQTALRCDLPLLYAEAGRVDDARRELDALAAAGWAAVADDMNHLASLAGLAQGAAALRDAARAGELYARLLPYRSRVVLIGRGAICLGPAELYLGILAAGDAAAAHFDAAIAWAREHDARPWLAWALALRGVPDAHALAAELGLGRLIARLNRPAAAPPSPPSRAPAG